MTGVLFKQEDMAQLLHQLERVHIEEKKLDRPDFLRYVLEKQMPAPPGKSNRVEMELLL